VASTQLLNGINGAVALDGLRKQDYMLPGLKSLVNGQQLIKLDTKDRVERELALTESLLRLNYHLRFGKVDPVSLDSNWNYGKRLNFKNPMVALYQAIKNQNIKTLLDGQRPAHTYYHKLQKVLAHYRKFEAAGGWKPVKSGSTIKLGHKGERVIQVRERLMKTDDLLSKSTTDQLSPLYNKNLQQAVIRFQKQQSLDADGKVGKNTLKALNKSVADGVNQIRVNLERLRWVMQNLEDNFLLVDIPGFEAILIKDGQRKWQGKIQVGKAFSATPVFKGKLEYLEFNPTWTVPPSIIKRKILPGLRKDPGYLNKKGYLLLGFNGKKINPYSIDWKKIKRFPYIVRQPAGKNNALGQVKFIFPNPHFVFLHDTNHRELFARNPRTFSAGCIRVEKPFELAEQLLMTIQGWDRKNIDQLVASGKTKRAYPKDKIPVLITYTTVGMDEQGKARFKPDIYNRDGAVLVGLDGQIKIAKDVRKALKKFTSSQPTKTNY
jgi:murein L,D-transpeptidase YcbB/YkuD